MQYFQRGLHDIEDQITYAGSNFIFHDSQGFEAGDNKELQDVWKFIERRSAAIEVGDQLHAIWYHLLFLHGHGQLVNIFLGIAYPWMTLVPFYHQNLSSLLKGQGKVSCQDKYIIQCFY